MKKKMKERKDYGEKSTTFSQSSFHASFLRNFISLRFLSFLEEKER